MEEKLIFGENGAVLNSDSMTDEFRDKHDAEAARESFWPSEEFTERGMLYWGLLSVLLIAFASITEVTGFSGEGTVIIIFALGVILMLMLLIWQDHKREIRSMQRRRAKRVLGVLFVAAIIASSFFEQTSKWLQFSVIFSGIAIADMIIRKTTPP